jgi:uncharacterized damage-inducible protein DinB
MSVIDPTLREMFDGWQGYQDRMLKAVQALNDDQLTLGVSPELRPVRRLLMHVVATRVRWLASTGLQVSPETAPLGRMSRRCCTVWRQAGRWCVLRSISGRRKTCKRSSPAPGAARILR